MKIIVGICLNCWSSMFDLKVFGSFYKIPSLRKTQITPKLNLGIIIYFIIDFLISFVIIIIVITK